RKALDTSNQRSEDLNRDIALYKRRNQTAESDLNAARQAAADLTTQLDGLKSQVKQLSAKIGEAQGRYATCSDALVRARSERDAAIASKSTCEAKAVAVPP